MTIAEFASWLESSHENAEIKSFLTAIEAATPETVAAALTPQLDPAKVKEYLASKDAYPMLQPYVDKAKQEAVLRFRENELPKTQEEYFALRFLNRVRGRIIQKILRHAYHDLTPSSSKAL